MRGKWSAVSCIVLACLGVVLACSGIVGSCRHQTGPTPAVYAWSPSVESDVCDAWSVWRVWEAEHAGERPLRDEHAGQVVVICGTVGRWERTGTGWTLTTLEGPIRCELGAWQGRALRLRPGTRVRIVGVFVPSAEQPTLVRCSVSRLGR